MKNFVAFLLLVQGLSAGKILQTDLSSSVEISEAQIYFESIPVQLRNSFIIFHLRKGLLEKTQEQLMATNDQSYQSETYSELNEPKNFSSNLLNWAQEEFAMNDGHVAQLVSKNVVCLENGRCIEPGDVGANCCIF